MNINNLANNKEQISESIDKLLSKPIQVGERNKTILKIAISNKSKGMSLEENKEVLFDFTSKEEHQFTTNEKENRREIESMLKTIYNSKTSSKYRIAATAKEIFFSKEDIEEVLSIENKPLRKVYFAMLLHVKLYVRFKDDEEITFYMGYERFIKTLNLDNQTINDRLKKLQELGKIEFIRKGEYDKQKFDAAYEKLTYEERKAAMRRLPNIYKLTYPLKNVKEGYKLLTNAKDKEDNITYVNFQMMCSKCFKKNEIAQYFTKSEQKYILKYKYQQLKEII